VFRHLDFRPVGLLLACTNIPDGKSKYVHSQDYVFATDSNRAGRKRGKQPVWLAKIMQYHIQPAARSVGIRKNIGWHTLRHCLATSLIRNGEDIKVAQELLRHSSSRITLDVYARGVSADKRRAQSREVREFMPESTTGYTCQ
jgi:integrase